MGRLSIITTFYSQTVNSESEGERGSRKCPLKGFILGSIPLLPFDASGQRRIIAFGKQVWQHQYKGNKRLLELKRCYQLELRDERAQGRALPSF